MTTPMSDRIRNVALVSYTGAGKTSLLEACLYSAGAIPSMGSVASGNTVSDFEPEEVSRQISISSTVAHFDWKDTRLNVIDTPGALSFLGEAQLALQAADGVVIVLDATSGMKTELDKIWATITAMKLPCVLFINALDKERASPDSVVTEVEGALGLKTILVTVPFGASAHLEGIVDLVNGVAIYPVSGSHKVQEKAIPTELVGVADSARKNLVERVAETDDQLLEQYLSEGDLQPGKIRRGLKAGTLSIAFAPVFCGSALRNIGTSALLDAMAEYLPSPADRAPQYPLKGIHPGTGAAVVRQPTPLDPFSGFVFKTIIDPFVGRLSYVRVLSGTLEADEPFYNATRQVKEKGGHLFSILGKKYTAVSQSMAGEIVAIGKLKDTQTGDTICNDRHPVRYSSLQMARPIMSFALEPKSKADIEKVSLGLHRLVEEDPTLEFIRDNETKEMILSGMGQVHIDVTMERLRRKSDVEVVLHTPKVPYKETVRKMAQTQGKYKKQTGGHGQYGDCWLQIDPLPRGKGFVFENKIVGGAIPRNFIPAVEKGVIEAMQNGALANFPVVDVQVTVYDGSYHTVDSSEMSFKIAASLAFKKAMERANPTLLEPIMNVTVSTPDELVGAVIGDLNSRRGRILGINAKGSIQTVNALVPLAEMLTYAPSLTSTTGGRGIYTMEFASYEEVPREFATRIIEERKAGN